MKELKKVGIDEIGLAERKRMLLIVSDENQISCDRLGLFKGFVGLNCLTTILAMPDTQYIPGLRGWAKAQILASVVGFNIILALSLEEMKKELNKEWGAIKVTGPLLWNFSERLIMPSNTNLVVSEPISETDLEIDKLMMNLAFKQIGKSNCWFDPAGCVISQNDQVLVEAASSGLAGSHCVDIPINPGDLKLNQGERMFFCDSLHAERVAVSLAASKGINLSESKAYVTKFPCRACTQSLVMAGVKEILFKDDSYGLLETGDILKLGNVSLKRIRSKVQQVS